MAMSSLPIASVMALITAAGAAIAPASPQPLMPSGLPGHGVVVVSTPQEISLIDVDRAIQMFETTKVPVLGVCETMSYFVCDGCGKKHSIFRSGGGRRVAGRAGVPFLGGVPIDPRVADSGDDGRPIVLSHPDSPAAIAYREIAGAVAAELSILSVERGSYLETFSLEWKP